MRKTMPSPINSDNAAPVAASPPGERLAWLLFLATSAHLAFLQPLVEVIPGERAKIFSGLWCTVTLLLVLIFQRSKSLSWRTPAVLVSLTLIILILVSSFRSPERASSLARSFVILSAGLGGYWSARLLLRTPERQRFFLWFSLVLLVAVMLLCGAGIRTTGSIFFFLDEHYHPVGSRLILFSFVPLALVCSASRLKVAAGIVLLGVAYLELLLAGKNLGMGSALFVPPALGLLAVCLRTWSGRQLVIILSLLFLASATAGHLLRPIAAEKNKYHESVAYRIENLSFSWHLAREHPWFGIGLWSSRESYLKDYEIKYPYLTKEDFSAWTRKLKTSENSFLTFMADLGLPATLLYSGAVLVILGRLLNRSLQPAAAAVFPPLALLLPLVGEILHLQVFDGLFHPQVSWFFHLLLGMASTPIGSSALRLGVQKAFVARFLMFGAVIVGGAALGLRLSP
jgi:hypothetical protein